jgi:hypothetical protein
LKSDEAEEIDNFSIKVASSPESCQVASLKECCRECCQLGAELSALPAGALGTKLLYISRNSDFSRTYQNCRSHKHRLQF